MAWCLVVTVTLVGYGYFLWDFDTLKALDPRVPPLEGEGPKGLCILKTSVDLLGF